MSLMYFTYIWLNVTAGCLENWVTVIVNSSHDSRRIEEVIKVQEQWGRALNHHRKASKFSFCAHFAISLLSDAAERTKRETAQFSGLKTNLSRYLGSSLKRQKNRALRSPDKVECSSSLSRTQRCRSQSASVASSSKVWIRATKTHRLLVQALSMLSPATHGSPAIL